MIDFYLTLPSNSSMNYYPDNTLTDYITLLPNTIDLEGDWEVGLVEIQYPHNWHNVSGSTNERMFEIRLPSTDNPEGPMETYLFALYAGYYPTPEFLVKKITKVANVALIPTGKTIELKYDPVQEKVKLQPTPCILTVPEQIQMMLGMETNTLTSVDFSEQVVNMQPLDSLYVYCDVTEPRVVGDSLVPLLRIVPVEGAHSNLVTRIYENVHYVRVQRKSFQTIEIYIRDRTGKKVPFERGTLNVTLHFRQRKRFSSL